MTLFTLCECRLNDSFKSVNSGYMIPYICNYLIVNSKVTTDATRKDDY
ncbi:Uncharacterised protein [Shigella flexneri]|nr:Uncharacterised protein [Shigella flexneri]